MCNSVLLDSTETQNRFIVRHSHSSHLKTLSIRFSPIFLLHAAIAHSLIVLLQYLMLQRHYSLPHFSFLFISNIPYHGTAC